MNWLDALYWTGILLGAGVLLAFIISSIYYAIYSVRYVANLQILDVYEVDNVSRSCLIQVRDIDRRIHQYIGSGGVWVHYPGGDPATTTFSLRGRQLRTRLEMTWRQFYKNRGVTV